MKKTIEYRKDTAFVNRKNELLFLENYITERPENILFIYGPKSSGKTTLIYKFLEKIKKNQKVEVKHFNLREVYLGNYKDFLNSFFKVKEIISEKEHKLSFNLKFFIISRRVLNNINVGLENPFDIMKQELVELNEKSIKPIIIIDELQALQEIYMNGERELIKEIFNFFVALTKESHLAHIIISSSDGYFIDQVYNDSKLRKTSEFYEIDYLPKSDVIDWLTNLEKYSKIKDYTLTDEEIEIFWDTVGGSVWEIQYLLSKRFDNDTKKICEEYIRLKTSEIDYYIKLNELKKELFKKFLTNTYNKYGDLLNITADKNEIEQLLSDMVHNNILYFNPVTATFSPQGRSVELGIKLYFEELK